MGVRTESAEYFVQKRDMGAPFGPQGAIAGAVFGAILGGGAEFSNLKDQHQEQLQRVAWTAFRQRSGFQAREATMERVNDINGGGDQYWQFEFRDEFGGDHYIRVNKDSDKVEYRRGESGPEMV
jgi:hypothetical protein